MITLDTTEKSTTGNCYVTLAEANTYLEAHMQASVWTALDDERKKAALITATRLIETNQYGGRKSTQLQSLSWPRTSITDWDGYVVSNVPTKLKDAVCEMAIWELTEDDRLAGKFEVETMKSVDIGPIKYTMKEVAEYIPDFINKVLEQIGPNVVINGKSARVMVL